MKGFTKVHFGDQPMIEGWLARQVGAEALGPAQIMSFHNQRGLVAAIAYHWFVWPNICMSMAAAQRLWCTPKLLEVAFAYPFNQLNCGRVTAQVRISNQKCWKMLESVGFQLEGTLRRAHKSGDALLHWGMLREECRWLPSIKEKSA